MSDHIKLTKEQADELLGQLKTIHDAMTSQLAAVGDTWLTASGDETLAGAADGFDGEWRIHRDKTAENIQKMIDIVQTIVETFAEVDGELQGALKGN